MLLSLFVLFNCFYMSTSLHLVPCDGKLPKPVSLSIWTSYGNCLVSPCRMRADEPIRIRVQHTIPIGSRSLRVRICLNMENHGMHLSLFDVCKDTKSTRYPGRVGCPLYIDQSYITDSTFYPPSPFNHHKFELQLSYAIGPYIYSSTLSCVKFIIHPF